MPLRETGHRVTVGSISMIGVIFYHLGAFFSRLLPGTVARGFDWVIGQGNWMFRFRTRPIIIENLRVIHGTEFSERELRRRARRVVMNFARSIQMFLHLPFYEWNAVRDRCDFSEFEAAWDEVGRDKPFIIASGHIGPWELGGYVLSRMGVQIHTVALEHPSNYVTRFYSERRSIVGIQAHPLRGSFHILQHALESGDCVALLIDRAYGKAKKQFTLFGVESEFPIGP